MPLDAVGRRYADRLFENRRLEVQRKHTEKLATIQADFAKRNMIHSGHYLASYANVLVDQIKLLGEAKTESLLTAYEKSGIPFDDVTADEIARESTDFCHQQQHNAVGAIRNLIRHTFGPAAPPNLDEAVVAQIVQKVGEVMERIRRDLLIKRDEVILDEMKVRKAYAAGLGKAWDVFICHASEDKDDFVRGLAAELKGSGLSVWFDESTLTIGDSLRQKIDEGLAKSRYGIVVVSRSFFAKQWPQLELDGLVSREVVGTGTKVILPVWLDISYEEVAERSPMLAGRLAAKSQDGLTTIVSQLRAAMGL